jgi:amino acid adenylation domain-containing protein
VFDPQDGSAGNAHLTYGELNQRANQLAHHLQRLGVGPEQLVGVCMHRSLEMVIALLGILKAGGAYVPLDPTYPRERLAYMLTTAQPPVLLTQSWLAPDLPAHQAQVVCLDQIDLSAEAASNPPSPLADERLAYVIFTSGSTGQPKGVMNTHRAILNRLLWMQEAYQLTPTDRVLQKTPFSFDVSVWEFFWPLMMGATLVMARPEGHKDSAYLVQTIREQHISTLHFVPSMLQVFVREADLEHCTAIQRLICSGETLPADVQPRIWARLPHAQLHNLYGPTEAAVDVTAWACSPNSPYATVPIGRPIANLQIYLLDAQFQPVPVGVPGELFIGGTGLARGYLQRPELTAERFVPHPFSPEPGARLYRTGDLARYLPDGNIDFLGRLDFQVKLRGFRIELGEIEAALRQHPALHDAVVVARETATGDKHLVAYLAAPAAICPAAAELRAWLAQRLPDYMVPAAFVRLDHLPLSPSGKIDRKALPKPEEAVTDRRADYQPPRTPLEETLVNIWSAVLGVQPIGRHDHFLDLGGHSLLALRILFAIREELGVELSLDHLFRFSTIESLAASLEAAQRQPAGTGPTSIEPVPRDRPLPLSSQQLQLWFLAQLYPEWPVYNEPYTIYIHQAIEVAVLERAIAEIIQRHEILRTTYTLVDDQPRQVIHPPDRFSLPYVDLTSWPDESRESELLRLVTAEARRPFDLMHGPLHRFTLIKLAPTDYRLFVTMHHSMMDGVTLYQVFFLELQQLYRACLRGEPSPLPELKVQYADYAVWQNHWQAQVRSAQLDYWTRQLQNLSTLQLPTDRPRPLQPSFRGAYQCLSLSTALSQQLKTLARQEGVTLFVLLAAAIQTLLHRYSGQTDIALGTFTAGRHRPEIANLMGDFLNTIVLRSDLSGQPTFRALVRQVQQVTADAYAHQDLPFDQLVAALQPDRQLGQNALFRVIFVIEPPLPPHDLPWELSQMDVQTGTSKFDLGFELDDRPGGIIGRIEYNSDLFEAETIARLIGHLQTLLHGIVNQPSQVISDLPILTSVERQQLLGTWQTTTQTPPQAACLYLLIEHQAEHAPEAAAVVFEDQTLTYGELNRRANQLAHYLQQWHVGPEDIIGLCMERSLEMIISLLAIHKAGAAYLPLDPALPAARLAFALEDTRARLLITHSSLKHTVSLDRLTTPLVCVDEVWPTVAALPDTPVHSSVAASNLAYVIFTSGSTGRPKGVLVNHHGLSNVSAEQARVLGVNANSRVLQFSSLSFDASVFDIVMALTTGATLCLGSRETLLPGPALVQLLRDQAITIMTLTPSALAALPVEDLPALRVISVAGEACPAELVARWATRVQFFNLYGPTEATIWSTQAPGRPDQLKPPIGTPIQHVEVYVLDQHMQPVPIGVSGELYIGGSGLARGYLNQPDRTAESFVPHPFSQEPGARLYKSGDLARYLPNGELEYLGRRDQQVKVRGYRIELGEIETCLRQHPQVREAVVVTIEAEPPVSQLIAYLVAADGEVVSASNVRRFVQDRLPDYMLPAAFVLLDRLPLMPSGKVDRRALPRPQAQHLLTDQAYAPPRTPIEQALAELWGSLLNLPRVGIHDNFFEVGGHSLLVTQLIARANELFQVTLPIRALFEQPTIAQLAELITNQQLEEVEADALAQLLAQIENLPDDEAAALLSGRAH